MQMISIKDQKGLLLLDLNNIIRIESVSNYSRIYLAGNQTILVAKILQWFEELLCQHDFVRVHRSHIINLHFHAYIMDTGATLALCDGKEIPISRRRKMWVEGRLKMLKEVA